jgi:hypothetical protein
VAEGGSGVAPAGSVSGVGWRRLLRLATGETAARVVQGVVWGGAAGHEESMCVRAQLRGRARGGVHLGGGGNHGGARQGRLGVVRRKEQVMLK